MSDAFQGRGGEVHTAFQLLVRGAQPARYDPVGPIAVCRRGPMHLTHHARANRSCVTITGKIGIGKTQVAFRLAEYASERHKFADILLVRLKVRRRLMVGRHWPPHVCPRSHL